MSEQSQTPDPPDSEPVTTEFAAAGGPPADPAGVSTEPETEPAGAPGVPAAPEAPDVPAAPQTPDVPAAPQTTPAAPETSSAMPEMAPAAPETGSAASESGPAASESAPAPAPTYVPPPPPLPDPPSASGPSGLAATFQERPELAVGAAFAAGLVLALILKRLGR